MYDTKSYRITIAHEWARGRTTDIRSKDSLYVEGETIFSYGYHYPIAVHTPFVNDYRAIILFNEDDSTKTTGEHKRIVSNAISPSDRDVYVSGAFIEKCVDRNGFFKQPLLRDIKDELQRRNEAVDHYIGKHERAYIHSYFSEVANELEVIRQLWQNLSFDRRRITKAEKRYVNISATDLVSESENNDRVKKKWQKSNESFITNFRNFRSEGQMLSSRTGYTYIRYNEQKREIETSKGFRVSPVRAYEVLSKCEKASNCAKYFYPDLTIWNYRVDYIGPDGSFKAGCHTIPRDEVFRMIDLMKAKGEWNFDSTDNQNDNDYELPTTESIPATA